MFELNFPVTLDAACFCIVLCVVLGYNAYYLPHSRTLAFPPWMNKISNLSIAAAIGFGVLAILSLSGTLIHDFGLRFHQGRSEATFKQLLFPTWRGVSPALFYTCCACVASAVPFVLGAYHLKDAY